MVPIASKPFKCLKIKSLMKTHDNINKMYPVHDLKQYGTLQFWMFFACFSLNFLHWARYVAGIWNLFFNNDLF